LFGLGPISGSAIRASRLSGTIFVGAFLFGVLAGRKKKKKRKGVRAGSVLGALTDLA
jgi:hypothetical protein